ncbi:MAG: hypothetical protein ACYDIC_12575 [Desulfobaccales bacterium]
MKPKSLLYLVGLVSLLTMALWGLAEAPGEAQQVSPSATLNSTSKIEIPPPRLRTWQEMEAAAALEAAGPPPPLRVKKFYPTRGEAEYRALKAKAAQTSTQQAQLAPSTESAAPQAPTTLTNPINFDGVDQAGAASPLGQLYPPDTEGAVGLNHFVEITNSHLDIYQKAAPNTRVKSVTLASFFGYNAAFTLFDPRVIYDAVSNRWIITADADPESATVQRFFFAVSLTADPTGSFYIYNVNVNDPAIGPNSFWDFPQVGMDRNAIIFTANLFNGNNFVDARMFTVAKSTVYNGPSHTVTPTKLFTGLRGTLSAPIVLDTNANTYLVAADDALFNRVWIYTLTNSAGNPPTLSAAASITVPTFYYPANAQQPGQGTTHLIDTLDARFVNAGTQIGNSLFQVHSISVNPSAPSVRAKCRFYEFDTVNKTVIQSGDFSRSGTSFDFNASIAANQSKDVFVTWSATDPTNSVNAEVRFSGRLHTDTPGVIPSPGSLLFGSAPALTGNSVSVSDTTQRWGDYSAVTIDPADATGLTAWIVNERILDANHWGTRIGSIKLPALAHRALTGAYLLLLLD